MEVKWIPRSKIDRADYISRIIDVDDWQAAEGWIFFVQNLVGENCLVVSTVSLISRAIHNLFVTKATATIVVPFWPSSFFWPIIFKKFASSTEDYKRFNTKDALDHGRNTN